MPDLLNYWLSGRKACEFTMATTTQCYDPRDARGRSRCSTRWAFLHTFSRKSCNPVPC